MQARELRQMYLEFFEGKGALRQPSDSLVADDPTLLFTVAGMVAMKPYYWGTATPPRKSLTTTQKCLRTVDIDDIGDISHCTFFEMLGNFSFGDYFKEEAITWAWEFLTEVLKLDPKDLRVTIYQDDDAAYELWKGRGLPDERITRLGQKTNFWPANAIVDKVQGPCGPCSEIFFDLQPNEPFDVDWDGEGDRWLEIWNLVFTQFTGEGEGDDYKLLPLPVGPSIDTGMGLERTVAAINRLSGPFETDVLRPIISRIEGMSGKFYSSTPDAPHDIAFRRVADHARATTFLLADGVTPDRSGRGYVLRRLMRRAIVAGIRQLGFADEPFLHEIIPTVVEVMRDAYPELVERERYILGQVRQEEALFRRTLQNGLARLEDELAGGMLSGRRAFYLYETFGLPFEITREIAAERGVEVDRGGYDEAEQEARERSRAASEMGGTWAEADPALASLLKSLPATPFLGYETLEAPARVVGLVVDGKPTERIEAGQSADVLLDVTPFYAEAGGQVGDAGVLRGIGGAFTVTDTQKRNGLYFHKGTVATGAFVVGDGVAAEVDASRRRDVMRNHTATHLLHKALRSRLGSHVQQRGSLVAPDRLRFDFAHGAAMTPDELRDVEAEVNQAVLNELPVETTVKPIEEARQMGAMALFGEKYGDSVRVVSVGGDYSREFCGGTHVANASQIGPFRLVSEGSAAAGIRRVEALTGRGAEAHDVANADRLKRIASLLGVKPTDAPEAVERLLAQLRETQQKAKTAQAGQIETFAEELAKRAKAVNEIPIVVASVDDNPNFTVAALADAVLRRIQSGVVILGEPQGSNGSGKIIFVVKAAKDATAKGVHAGEIVRAAAQAAGGGGGGRPDFAQAGGKDSSKLADALAAAEATLAKQLG